MKTTEEVMMKIQVMESAVETLQAAGFLDEAKQVEVYIKGLRWCLS